MISWKLLSIGFLISAGVNGQSEYWLPISSEGVAIGSGTLVHSNNLNLSINTQMLVPPEGSRYVAGFDGESWVVIADSVSSGFNTLADFEDGILIGGSTPYIGSQNIPHMAFYDGIEWTYPFTFNASVSKLKWVNDTLFALGHFTEIDGLPAYKIAKLVNGVWQGVLEPYDDLSWSNFLDITYYQGEYYVGGNFESVEGPDDFAILRDGTLHEVGQGITGSWAAIGSLEIYQDNLYLAGTIPMVQGNIGDHILRWDGENYHALAGPFLNEQGLQSIAGADIGLMKVHGDYLYIVGDFHYINDGYFNRIARWDGAQWCGLHTDHLTEGIFAFDFINNQLFLRSPTVYSLDPLDYDNFILYLGGDDVSSCATPLSISYVEAPDVSLYPNPVLASSTTDLSIASSIDFNQIAVYDMSGRLVFQESIVPTTQYALRLSNGDFGAGMYVVHLMGKGHLAMEKLVIIE